MKQQFFARVVVISLVFLLGNYAIAQTESCGPITFELYDSYGDGWNGPEIDVEFTGGDSTYNLSSGSYVSIPLSVNYLDTTNFVWAADGSYPIECTYTINS